MNLVKFSVFKADKKRNMRKKNVPKSSTDVTDSNDGSNSEDEIEDSDGKSSESEEDIRVKRKRRPTAKKRSEDDDDEDYMNPYVFQHFIENLSVKYENVSFRFEKIIHKIVK